MRHYSNRMNFQNAIDLLDVLSFNGKPIELYQAPDPTPEKNGMKSVKSSGKKKEEKEIVATKVVKGTSSGHGHGGAGSGDGGAGSGHGGGGGGSASGRGRGSNGGENV